MLDVKAIRANPERLKKIIHLRKVDPLKANVDLWLNLDKKRRALQSEIDGLNAEKKKIADLGKTNPDGARLEGQKLRGKARNLDKEFSDVTKEWKSQLDWFPNFIDSEMPEGKDESENVEECAWTPVDGYLDGPKLGQGNHSAEFMPKSPLHAETVSFKPLHYTELGQELCGIDTLQGGKVSGSRFAYIYGDIALMQMAIHRLLSEELVRRGYQPIIPPLLVRERSLYGTSQFPEGRDQVYEIKTDNVEEPFPLFLVGSSEPTNFSYFMDKVLNENKLPIKIFAATPCFRSEAGSWGKDVKGIKRVHQFDKIEMNAVCEPDNSKSIYEEFKAINEWLMQQLKIPYRIVDKCTGDAGYLASYRQRDVEAWMSGSGEFMEVMTDTNTTDYQARRLNIRYRAGDGSLRFCHTVNDTGCAMGRMLIAILDNYQQSDGSVKVPEVLAPLMMKDVLRTADGPK